MRIKFIIALAVLLICASFVLAKDDVGEFVAIKGATIIPVIGDDIDEGVILIKGNLIEAIGKDIDIPQGAKIIDAKGLFVYPGMIDGLCFLGLQSVFLYNF